MLVVISLEFPKSDTFVVQCSSNRMFVVFTSLCITGVEHSECKYASTLAVSAAILTRFSHESREYL